MGTANSIVLAISVACMAAGAAIARKHPNEYPSIASELIVVGVSASAESIKKMQNGEQWSWAEWWGVMFKGYDIGSSSGVFAGATKVIEQTWQAPACKAACVVAGSAASFIASTAAQNAFAGKKLKRELREAAFNGSIARAGAIACGTAGLAPSIATVGAAWLDATSASAASSVTAIMRSSSRSNTETRACAGVGEHVPSRYQRPVNAANMHSERQSAPPRG